MKMNSVFCFKINKIKKKQLLKMENLTQSLIFKTSFHKRIFY